MKICRLSNIRLPAGINATAAINNCINCPYPVSNEESDNSWAEPSMDLLAYIFI